MDASAITSAAQAVHQELVRRLAEQARINRLRDQLRRARPGTVAPSPSRPGAPVGSTAWPGIAFPSPARSGAAIGSPGGHADPHVHAQPDAGSWLSPRSPYFGPAATGGPGRDATAGLTGPGGAAALHHPPAAPA